MLAGAERRGPLPRVAEDFGNVRLVGMTRDELQGIYNLYRKSNPATGIDEVWMLPHEVILNTRRACSTINTTVDGYSASLGAPEERYIALPEGHCKRGFSSRFSNRCTAC